MIRPRPSVLRFRRPAPVLAFGLAASSLGCTGDDTSATDNRTPRYQGVALATDLPEVCQGDDIFRIQRPVAALGQVQGSFDYGYRFEPPTVEGAPVLVFLPDGPGQTSIERPPRDLPDGWGYLLTDPRGVGCNRPDPVPSGDVASAFFSTFEIAGDVMAAIEHQRLRDYVLYGVGYGTVVATSVASTIAGTRLVTGRVPPRAVVLESVLGRAYMADEFVGQELITQWNGVRASLPGNVLKELDTAPEPYGIDAEGWSRALPRLMAVSPDETAALLASLAEEREDDANERLEILRDAAATPSPPPPGQFVLEQQVVCREIVDTTPANGQNVVFVSGELVRNTTEEGTKCGELEVSAPYDSALLQFDAPAYYFIGSDDVVTPAWQGAYHFDNHHGPATRIVTEGGGSRPLSLNQRACAPELLASIGAGGNELESVLAECPAPVQVDSNVVDEVDQAEPDPADPIE